MHYSKICLKLSNHITDEIKNYCVPKTKLKREKIKGKVNEK